MKSQMNKLNLLAYAALCQCRKLIPLILAIACTMPPVLCHALEWYNDDGFDAIQLYQVYIQTERDGALTVDTHIEWQVLRDRGGGLNQISIGVPNTTITDITIKSDSIKSLVLETTAPETEYDYAVCLLMAELSRSFNGGDEFDLDFSYRVSGLGGLDDEENVYRFDFTPGWFEGLTTERLFLYWPERDVISVNTPFKNDDYYVWEAYLPPGSSLQVTVDYPNTGIFVTPKPSFEPREPYDYKTDNNPALTLLYVALGVGASAVYGQYSLC